MQDKCSEKFIIWSPLKYFFTCTVMKRIKVLTKKKKGTPKKIVRSQWNSARKYHKTECANEHFKANGLIATIQHITMEYVEDKTHSTVNLDCINLHWLCKCHNDTNKLQSLKGDIIQMKEAGWSNHYICLVLGSEWYHNWMMSAGMVWEQYNSMASRLPRAMAK